MSYTIEEHRHRFASWAASRAAMTSKLCRFKVSQGESFLEGAGLKSVARSIESLPKPNDFDASHRKWRQDICELAHNQNVPFTHGVAAKLVNVYLKTIFTCGGHHDDDRVKAIHPPIDDIMLKSLAQADAGGFRHVWKSQKWSKLSSEQYETLIKTMRAITPSESGLWTLESYWTGYQRRL